MKNNNRKALDRAVPRPAKTDYTALRQIVQWIPEGLPDRIAREAKADIRAFTCTSHVLALGDGAETETAGYEQLAHGEAQAMEAPEVIQHPVSGVRHGCRSRETVGTGTGTKGFRTGFIRICLDAARLTFTTADVTLQFKRGWRS